MATRLLNIIRVLACVLGTLGAGTLVAAPAQVHVDSLSTRAGLPGMQVTLVGQGFGGSPGAVVLTGRRVEASS